MLSIWKLTLLKMNNEKEEANQRSNVELNVFGINQFSTQLKF